MHQGPSAVSSRRGGFSLFPVVPGIMALVVALLLLALWVPVRTSPLTVTYTRGGAVLEAPDGSRLEIAPGTMVEAGQKLVVPAGASVSLTLPDGHSVTATDSAVLDVTASKGALIGGKVETRLDVQQGNVRITGEGRGRTSLDIGLPYGVAGVRGTVFTAQVGAGRDMVSVHQGTVAVAAASGGTMELTPGQGALISSAGVAVSLLPPAPALQAPDAGAVVDVEGTQIAWIAVEGAAGYVLEVAADDGFTQILTRIATSTASVAVPVLEEDARVHIRVFAVTGDGLEGPTSGGRELEIRLRRARGLAFLAQGGVGASIDELLAAVPNFDEDFELLRDLGWAYYLESRYTEAREAYDRALALRPDDIEVRLESARVLFFLEEYGQAEDIYRSILAETPDDADALWGLGDAYRITGRRDEATELVERALRIQPDHPYAGETLRRLREGG